MSDAPNVARAPAAGPLPPSAYGWVIVAITFLAMALVLGSRFSLGMFLPYLPDALEASPAAVSGALAISMLGAAALQPVMGYLLDVWGGRIVLSIGLASAGLALCGTAIATELWQLTLFMGLASSVAYAAVSPVSSTSIVASWFERNRGAALGVATSGTKVAMVVLPPVLAIAIAIYDWRAAMLAVGLAAWLLIPAVLLLMRPAPGSLAATKDAKRKARRKGVAVDADGAEVTSPATAPAKPGMAYREALLHPTFWLIAFALFANGLIMNLVFIHLPSYMVGQGYSESIAAAGLSMLAATGILGTVVTGALSDRTGRRNVLLVMFAARGVTALMVLLAPGPVTLIAFVVVFGLLGYGAIGVIGALASELFGQRAIGAILGSAYVFNQVGGAVGTFAGGASLELTGDYGASLWLAIAATLLSFACILFIREKRA